MSLPAGEYSFDIVFWYFNVLERARLHVRQCYGGASPCVPNLAVISNTVHTAR